MGQLPAFRAPPPVMLWSVTLHGAGMCYTSYCATQLFALCQLILQHLSPFNIYALSTTCYATICTLLFISQYLCTECAQRKL